ncbi:MAG: FtsQ-type POTRA domain-containing protein [Proteobacteria bacterium]|nr:FtsQ-type POTRA domain-containing protein [Pseudomonadota bacterium]
MRWIKNLIRRLGRWLLWLIKATLLAGLAGALTWLFLQGWHVWNDHQQGELVQVKLVSQTAHVNEEEIKALLKPQLGLGFWQLDLPAIRKLVETHPWVARAEVSRFWPNSLRIEVVEQTPVARWGDDALLNQMGEIFKPPQLAAMDDLIQLSAVNPEPVEVLTMLKQMLALINPYGLHIKALHRLADGSWHAWLVNEDEWLLPAQDTLPGLQRLLMLYGSIPHRDNAKMRIDLRYRDGFAVKWLPNENPTVSDIKP